MSSERPLESAARMIPLLRAIAHEIHDRTGVVKRLQQRVDAFGGTRRAHREEIERLQEDIVIHRRALRIAHKELAVLGWCVTGLHPMRLLRRGANGAVDVSWQPSEESLRMPADPAA